MAVVNTIVTAFQTVFDVIVGTFKSVFNLTEGVIGLLVGMNFSLSPPLQPANFLLGNFVLILSLVVVYFGYIEYQKRQGNRNPQPLKNAADTASKKLK